MAPAPADRASREYDRVVQLAALHKLAVAADWPRVHECLQEPLMRYRELELRSDGQRIDLITLTHDSAAADGFWEIMRERGAQPADCAAAQALARFGTGATLGMKLPVAGTPYGGEFYVRAALPLAEAEQFLRKRGAGDHAIDQMHRVAAAFAKPYLHMLAADIGMAPHFSYFFTTFLDIDGEERDRDRVHAALEAAGISPAGIEGAMRVHALFGASRPETMYFSTGIVAGRPAGRVKLDYVAPRLGVVCEALATIGDVEGAGLPVHWGRILGVMRAGYAGAVIAPDGPVAIRAYFTRHTNPGHPG